MAGEHAVLNMSERVAVDRWVVLVGAAEERNISTHVSREVFHIRLPWLVPIGIGAAGELHMQEYPVLKNDAEGIRTPVEIPGFLGHIDSRSCSLDRISRLIEHRIQGLDEDGDLALVIEVGELLQTDGILVLNPRFNGRTAIIVPSVGRIHVTVLERQYGARNGTPVDAEVGDINLQYIYTLIGVIRGIIRELGVENDVVLRLVVLELNGACSEVIACRIEHICISKGCRGRRPP